MLREIKNAHDNIQKQKTQQKLVDKEKLSLNKTLKKLKDNGKINGKPIKKIPIN